MAIEIKEVPVEVYNSIGKIKRYHTYYNKLIKLFKISLQIAVKAINNLAELDKIIFSLLVFKVYL